MRWPARPSHLSGTPPFFQSPAKRRRSVGSRRAGSVPISSLVRRLTRLRTLGGIAQGDAGNDRNGRLLGDAAGVGDHRLRLAYEVIELEIGLGVDQSDRRRQRAERVERFSCARMHRKDNGPVAACPGPIALSGLESVCASSTFAGRCSVSTNS